ncbi:YbeU/YbeR family protein [Carnimonas nigrificans]|uniref:YbeU/YbeR family protein n=1 Tax=Carnimonas nigrificans TaxID=64323 RepID=UPI0004720FC2|nr:YbeU/YbeR family protein [Carnimonas nigrificans]
MADAIPDDEGVWAEATDASAQGEQRVEPDALVWRLLALSEVSLGSVGAQARHALHHLDQVLDTALRHGQLSTDDVERWRRAASGEQVPHEVLWGGKALLPWRLRAGVAPLLTLSAESETRRACICQQLASQWDVRDRDALVKTLLWLSAQGDRYSWDMDAHDLTQLTSEERLAWRARRLAEEQAKGRAADPTEPHRTALLIEWVEQQQPLEWAAWDWLRLVELACQGVRCGWLSEEEGRGFTVHAVHLMQQRYANWGELAAACQRGRWLLSGPPDEAERERWNLLLTARLSPWKRPLTTLIGDSERQAAHDFMLQWRCQPWHFAMALAAIRDPALVARCAGDMERASERVEEARGYLADVLEWAPGDDDQALMRCWQPALVHCLNQCAADAARGVLPSGDTAIGSAVPEELAERARLAFGAPYSATIHMAEKYAFHLVMAVDADVIDGARFLSLAKSLCATLCCFYGSPQPLIEAWRAWETALASPVQASLVAELEWHLADPGSVLKWVPWRGRGAFQEPGERPSLREFTALALIGPLNAVQWSLPVRAGHAATATLIDWLDSHYGLASAAGLTAFLDFLAASGDRQEYQINYAPYTLNHARLEGEIAILESAARSENEQVHLERLRRVKLNSEGCNDHDLAAWDIAQLVDLACAGVSVGWLDRDQLSSYLALAETLAATHYSGWQDYASGLLAGAGFFMPEEAEQQGVISELRQALIAWLTGVSPWFGCWSCLTFPGQPDQGWPSRHIDVLSADHYTLH